jgi:hypothetical protein
VIFANRTRRVPVLPQAPNLPLTLAAFAVVTVAPATPLAAAPASPAARWTTSPRWPLDYFAALAGMVVAYLVLIRGRQADLLRRGHIVAAGTAPARPAPPPAPSGRPV